jgi:DNA-binding transcriptional ArsR family regulator
MNKVYAALSDPTRRKVLVLLRKREMTAGELSKHFPLAKPTLSRHFQVLKEADLIYGRKVGTSIIYALNLSVLEELMLDFMSKFELELETEDHHARKRERSRSWPRKRTPNIGHTPA